ncbi:MAG TPA: substrate-binding domain-containing protein [Gemmataceae bacterium]|nr:substrate-binding domain-containing protein [Gemmataceae bacterium]
MPRWGYVGLALVASLALAGCGPKADYKYRVVVIPKGLTHEHWQSVHRGADRAAASLAEQGIKVEVIWDGPRTEDDAQAQITLVDRHVAGGVSGIVLAPQHSETMVAPVKRAVDKGIPVVAIDSGLADQDVLIKYIATDNYNGGKLAAERLLKVLRNDGKPAPKLVLFRYAKGSESTEQREKGFEDHINKVIDEQKKKGEPTITWLSNDKYAGATADSALKVASPLLGGLQDQGIDGIFAVNESSATGMLRAMQSLKLNKKVRLVGFDSSPPLLQAVSDGDIDGLILQDPYKMGYLSVWTLVKHLEGYDVAPDGDKEWSTGEYLVTRENIDEKGIRQLFDPDLQMDRGFGLPELKKR